MLDGLAEVGGMRLRKLRVWYTSREDRYLGTDEIIDAAGPPHEL